MSNKGDPKDGPTAENVNINNQTVNVGPNKVGWAQVLAGLATAATLIAFGVMLVNLLSNDTVKIDGVSSDPGTTSATPDQEPAGPSGSSADDSTTTTVRDSKPSNSPADETAESIGLKNLLDNTALDDGKISCEPIHLLDAWPIGDEEDTGLGLNCGQIRLVRADKNDEKVVLKRLNEDVSSMHIRPALVDQVLLLAYISPDDNARNIGRRPGGWFRVEGGPDGLWLGQGDREDVLLYPDDGSPAVDLRSPDYDNQIEIIRLYLAEELASAPGSLITVSAGSRASDSASCRSVSSTLPT